MSNIFRHLKDRRLVRRLLLVRLLFKARIYGIQNPKLAYKRIWNGVGFSTTVLVLKAPLSLIRVTHFEKGIIIVNDSPHFDYVLSEFGVRSSDSASKRLAYRGYHRRQTGGGEKFLDSKEKSFRSLISTFRSDNVEFEILVKWDSSAEVFRVVDGFHRLACIAALHPGRLVTCRVVS